MKTIKSGEGTGKADEQAFGGLTTAEINKIAAMMTAEEERREETEGIEETFVFSEAQAGKVGDEKAGRNK